MAAVSTGRAAAEDSSRVNRLSPPRLLPPAGDRPRQRPWAAPRSWSSAGAEAKSVDLGAPVPFDGSDETRLEATPCLVSNAVPPQPNLAARLLAGAVGPALTVSCHGRCRSSKHPISRFFEAEAAAVRWRIGGAGLRRKAAESAA